MWDYIVLEEGFYTFLDVFSQSIFLQRSRYSIHCPQFLTAIVTWLMETNPEKRLWLVQIFAILKIA